ncbi:MAG TPA: DUF484 domain-containing protein [Betaproteobacteria bacterium]|nr:DUF484 domain-containing protein [Betaproteobacteria bacterium]
MTALEIASYLKNHPEFFEEFAEVLTDIYLPHPHGDRAISLSERQILTLREKNTLLENRLRDLIQFGEENDTISEKLHQFTLALFPPRTLESSLDVIKSNLRDIFDIPHAAVRIWTGQPDTPGLAEFSGVGMDICAFAGELAHPQCGVTVPDEVSTWFGDTADKLRSFALVALREEEAYGLLVLASEAEHRFFANMGTLYLKRLGDLVGAALTRHLADETIPA